MKRQMQNPEYFIGKQINSSKWDWDRGNYGICRVTGKFTHVDNTVSCYIRCNFDRNWLIANNLYVEEAEYVSVEGYEIIVDRLTQLGYDETYTYPNW